MSQLRSQVALVSLGCLAGCASQGAPFAAPRVSAAVLPSEPPAAPPSTAATVAGVAAAAPSARGAVADNVPPEAEAADPVEALRNGRFWLKLRYRLESVDQDGFARDALASTLRTVLGYESQPFADASALLEFEDVSDIGNDRQFDSPVHPHPNRPTVADPDGTEINQAFLRYVGIEDTEIRLGRQRITLDNHRFVGNVGWRQNEQTFDAASVTYEGLERTSVFWAYLDNVNRIFGDQVPAGDARANSSILHVAYDTGDVGKLSAYWYYLDLESLAALSTSTYGARFTGSHGVSAELDALYTAEYAHQVDAGDNPNEVDADYWLGEVGVAWKDIRAKLGYEVLGGSTGTGDKFTTPLSTLHAFNGWADKFLATPDAGLEDRYVSLAGDALGNKWAAIYHDFTAETGGTDYGSELDLLVTRKLTDEIDLGLKFADYSADNFATDTQKLWFWAGFAL